MVGGLLVAVLLSNQVRLWRGGLWLLGIWRVGLVVSNEVKRATTSGRAPDDARNRA